MPDTGRDFGNLSFRALDEREGRDLLPPAAGEEYPLPAWYRSVYETPFRDFDMTDFRRALQQGLAGEAVVHCALAALQHDPLAGDLYDGDVLLSLKSLPKSYWAGHLDHKRQAKDLLWAAYLIVASDEYQEWSGDKISHQIADLEKCLV